MDFISTLAGKLKIATVVCGLIAMSIMADTYDFSRDDKPKTFFAFIIIAFIISTLLLIASLLKLNEKVGQWKAIDAGLHALLGVLLAIGWIVFVIFVSDMDTFYRKTSVPRPSNHKTWLTKSSFVLIFEIINIPLYSFIAFLVFKRPA